jgi:dGTP triphosphohydrolase
VIKNVLVEVRERNLARANATAPEDPSTSSSTSAVKTEDDSVKLEQDIKPDIASAKGEEDETLLPQEAEAKLLSLDYVHGMTDEMAMKELESFKGVGPKSEC